MNVRQVIPRDAIPSVDDPEFGPDYFGDPDDEVIVVESDGDGEDREVRAYPVRILHYHEIVNDELGGDPIAVTWCPLCGSAVVYDRGVGDRVLEFGVSGKLADDDLVMYDRGTDSEWKQSLGEAIAGELAGESLRVRPSSVTTYERFRAEYDGRVLRRPGGESEASGPGDDPEPIEYDDAPYADYFEGDGFGLAAHRGEGGREWSREDLDPKTVVLGVEASESDSALGFPLPRVERAGGVARATVGDRDLAVFAAPDGIHAFENPGYEFEAAGEAGVFSADGARWDGATGESDDGRKLARVAARRLFAFAWRDDHGDGAFWSAE
ncbi:DUF3179 domain-containing protein [Halorussus caseinilyticus]|uniref:DUF3179 domain-containing protein n=1 Tax=Halorussus caseinilyticus TaxID=3034025 RepID=A0ABD5WI56_9EURY|nr:DUF3179 domain-containing protein [Halorussus sp. DT72]